MTSEEWGLSVPNVANTIDIAQSWLKTGLYRTSSLMESPCFSGILVTSAFAESYSIFRQRYSKCMTKYVECWHSQYLHLNDHDGISEAIALQHVQRVPKGLSHQSPMSSCGHWLKDRVIFVLKCHHVTTDQRRGSPPTGRRHFALPAVKSVIREPYIVNLS